MLYTEPNFLGESQFLGLGGWILSMDLSEDVNPNVIRLPSMKNLLFFKKKKKTLVISINYKLF